MALSSAAMEESECVCSLAGGGRYTSSKHRICPPPATGERWWLFVLAFWAQCQWLRAARDRCPRQKCQIRKEIAARSNAAVGSLPYTAWSGQERAQEEIGVCDGAQSSEHDEMEGAVRHPRRSPEDTPHASMASLLRLNASLGPILPSQCTAPGIV